jgi:hypothetical protein
VAGDVTNLYHSIKGNVKVVLVALLDLVMAGDVTKVMRSGIMVCITLIFEALEHVLLNPSSFHDVCFEIILFSLFKLGKVTQFPSKSISL